LDTSKLILETAQKFFSHFGFKKTTVDDIATASHIAKSTIYHHYPSKQDLFRRVVEHEGQVLSERINDAIKKAASPQEKISAYVHARLHYLKELANYYSALRDDYLEYYSFIEQLREDDLQNERMILSNILMEGVRDGTFRIDESKIDITALAIITALKGLEYPWLADIDASAIDENVKVLLDLLFNGIRQIKPG